MLKPKQGGFAVIYLILVLAVVAVMGLAVFRWTQHKPATTAKATVATKLHEITAGEGSQTYTVDDKTVLKLPSGATIDLTSFTFNPDKGSTGEVETNQFKHSATFQAYHRGYLYEFKDYSCRTGQVWHDDYSSNDRLSCTFQLSAKRVSPPAVAGYDSLSQALSSQSVQIYDHSFRTAPAGQAAAYYEVEVPYLQFWGKGDGVYWGATGNALHIKTVYGIGTINFDENAVNSDVRNRSVKSVYIGPVTAQARITGVSCYVPYLTAGQCSPSVMTSGPNAGQTVYTYNRVDYALSFSQAQKPASDQLVLHY
jgi:hypothetical protein